MTAAADPAEAVFAELERIAEIAAAILDGDEIGAIITEKAMHYISDPDPQFRFLSGDYFDVDHEAFLRARKLLMRLERLGKVRISSSLWLPVPDAAAVTVAVQTGPHHRYYRFGQDKADTPPEMRKVFEAGQVRRAPADDGDRLATVLAPVRDSLGDVAAIVELTAPLTGPPPAWS